MMSKQRVDRSVKPLGIPRQTPLPRVACTNHPSRQTLTLRFPHPASAMTLRAASSPRAPSLLQRQRQHPVGGRVVGA